MAAADGIIEGNLDLADVMFLVAFVLAVVGVVLHVAARQTAAAVVTAAVAALAFGWLVL